MFAPSIIAAIAGPLLRNILVGSDAPLRVVESSASILGDAAIPTVTTILGANLLKLKLYTRPERNKYCVVDNCRNCSGSIYFPANVGALVAKGALQIGFVNSDPLYQFALLLQYALPPPSI